MQAWLSTLFDFSSGQVLPSGRARRSRSACQPGTRTRPGWPGATRHALRAALQVQGISVARAHAGASPRTRNAQFAPVSSKEKLALEQGVVDQLARGLPSARASASSTYIDKKFKENESRRKGLASHALAPVFTGFDTAYSCGGRIEIYISMRPLRMKWAKGQEIARDWPSWHSALFCRPGRES